MQEKLVVAYVCDANYISYLKKSINSIRQYNKNVEIVILTKAKFDISNVKFHIFNPDVSKFKFKVNDRMKEGVYYKFWLTELPYDKILYIDCDVICQRPLDELWNQKCDFICATESHKFGKTQATQLGLKKYALSGMMLMNLKALREINFTQRCLDRLQKENPKFHDETIINLEFNDKITFIDKKYNYCHNREYDNPIDEADAYLLHYVGKKEQKQEMLNLGEFNGLSTLKQFLKNKSVAIVGNSSSILEKQQGLEIDEHDIVIRFNRGFPYVAPLSLGTHTDILFLACTLTNQELAMYNAKYTVRRSKLCHNICTFNIDRLDRARISQQPGKLIKPGHRSQPSTGFVAINFVLTCDYKKLDVYGFDFFKTPTYYNPKGYQTLHNGNKEGEKVLEYQKCGLLTIK